MSFGDYRKVNDEEGQTLLGPNGVTSYGDAHAKHDHHVVTSRLRVANLCCAGEEKIIKEALLGMTGIEKVSVSIVNRSVIIQHCDVNECTPAEMLVTTLNKKHLGVSIQEVGQDSEIEEESPMMHVLQIVLLWVLVTVGTIFSLISSGEDQNAANILFCTAVVLGMNTILAGIYKVFLQGVISIHVLMSVALFGALLRKEYFDAALVVTLFGSGELTEEMIMHHVRNTINRSVSNYPTQVTKSDGTIVKLSEVKINDIIAVSAGDVIMVDGTVVKGEAATIGSSTISGSLVQNGFLEIRASMEVTNGTLTKMQEIIEDVESSNSNYSRIVDQIASFWAPAILSLVVLYILYGRITSGSWGLYIQEGLVMMVLSCPCSLILATPIPASCAIVKGAQHGVLIRNLGVIEDVANTERVAIDKTGTLTTGRFAVLVTFEQNDPENPMRLAAAIENRSTHPLANAMVASYFDCVADFEGELPALRKFQVNEGVGLSAWVEVDDDWKIVQVGNERLLKKYGGKVFLTTESAGRVIVYIIVEDTLAGMVALADQLRPEASEFVQHMNEDSTLDRIVILTGDTEEVAMVTADAVGISTNNVYSRLFPTDKLNYILQSEKRGNVTEVATKADPCRVMMIGDGINDSPSLAAASVGVAMGAGGAAVSVAAAKVILMNENLLLIPATKKLCHFTCKIILENCSLAIGLKIIAMIFGFTNSLKLWQAMLIDVATLIIVLLNGIRPLSFEGFDSLKKID
eukprot:GSChrysophyteH1.ASY1.ANO1.3242.1 assembled CDS